MPSVPSPHLLSKVPQGVVIITDGGVGKVMERLTHIIQLEEQLDQLLRRCNFTVPVWSRVPIKPKFPDSDKKKVSTLHLY
jgi:hypothetical protein